MTTVRVYFNGRGVDAPADGSTLDALRIWDEIVAGEVASGTRALADSRGLPADPAAAVYGGAIFRVVSGRAREAASE